MQADVQVRMAGAVDLSTPNTPPAMTKPDRRLLLGLAFGAALLGGCEQLGIRDPAKAAAQAEADGKAVGSACRHAGRAIEDCFTLNPAAPRAAVFAGWKEMNDYMAEKNIPEVAPLLPPPAPPGAAKAAAKAKHAKSDTEDETEDTTTDSKAKADEAAPAEAESPRKRRRTAD